MWTLKLSAWQVLLVRWPCERCIGIYGLPWAAFRKVACRTLSFRLMHVPPDRIARWLLEFNGSHYFEDRTMGHAPSAISLVGLGGLGVILVRVGSQGPWAIVPSNNAKEDRTRG